MSTNATKGKLNYILLQNSYSVDNGEILWALLNTCYKAHLHYALVCGNFTVLTDYLNVDCFYLSIRLQCVVKDFLANSLYLFSLGLQ